MMRVSKAQLFPVHALHGGISLTHHLFFTVSLPADFLVWIASPEAKFLQGKLVFSAWDVEELKSRQKEIVGGPPGTGELWLGFQGFPRYFGGQLLPGA